jgi:hypothetical protein
LTASSVGSNPARQVAERGGSCRPEEKGKNILFSADNHQTQQKCTNGGVGAMGKRTGSFSNQQTPEIKQK